MKYDLVFHVLCDGQDGNLESVDQYPVSFFADSDIEAMARLSFLVADERRSLSKKGMIIGKYELKREGKLVLSHTIIQLIF